MLNDFTHNDDIFDYPLAALHIRDLAKTQKLRSQVSCLPCVCLGASHGLLDLLCRPHSRCLGLGFLEYRESLFTFPLFWPFLSLCSCPWAPSGLSWTLSWSLLGLVFIFPRPCRYHGKCKIPCTKPQNAIGGYAQGCAQPALATVCGLQDFV